MRIHKIAILFRNEPNRVPFEIYEHHVERIRQAAPGAQVVRAYEENELLEKMPDADVLLTWGMYKPVQFCTGAKSLKWIHTISAGVEGIMTPEIAKLDIKVSNSKGIHGIPIAEHTLALMLSFTRRFPALFRQQQDKKWNKLQDPDEIGGKTVGIIGLGSIGEEIAKKCKRMDMRVIATKRTPTACEWVDHLYAPNELNELLRQSDFVVLALPITPSTLSMIGKPELSLMKKTAYLINIARGGVIDQDALIQALQDEIIAGAGLDVFEVEPLPGDSPLWEMPNVIVTPHLAADSPKYMDRAIQVFCDNLGLYAKGAKMLNEVNKSLSY